MTNLQYVKNKIAEYNPERKHGFMGEELEGFSKEELIKMIRKILDEYQIDKKYTNLFAQ